ncbi:MAG: hypothetical protein WC071_12075 [Victivallaceae bacterium]
MKEGRRKYLRFFIFTVLFLPAVTGVYGQKVKQIRWNQDDAQRYMVSKAYELKYTMACDVTPFVEGAVKRYNVESKVQRLNYAKEGKEILLVSTAQEMMPYIDDMIAKIDRPGKADESGSVIAGTGISRYAYYPKHRVGADMLKIIKSNIYPGDGSAYRDASVSMLYWKTSKSDGDEILRWIEALDKPVPQTALRINVYEVRDSDLKDIGINYVAWKNGPGLDIFNVGMEAIDLQGFEQVLKGFAYQGANVLTNANYAWGGMFVAPQFDMSFVRLLNQTGKARIASSGSLTIINDFDNSYKIRFAPDFQNIVKDPETDQTTVKPSEGSNFELVVNSPVICFKSDGNKVSMSADGRRYDEEQVSKLDGTIMFNYVVSMADPVERNNFGAELHQGTSISSNLTLDAGTEKLLATWKQEYNVEQNIGVPFLSEIPVLKYLFGTTTTLKASTYYFVTVQADWITTDAKLAGWAGKLLTNDILKAEQKPAPLKVGTVNPEKAAVDKQDTAAANQSEPLSVVR